MNTSRTLMVLLILVAAAMAGQTSDKSEAVSVNPSKGIVGTGEVTVVVPVTNNAVLSNGAITIPEMMSYQGRLTDAGGVPVKDALYAVRFRLYAEPTGGTPFWEEEQQVRTRDGLFSVLLGSVTPITTDDGDQGSGIEAAYLGMAVESSEEMVPRLRIAGAAHAHPSGGTDDDDEWVRSGSDSVLYTIHRLGIARGGCRNKLYGSYACTQTNLGGGACTTGTSGYSLANMTIGGGYGNRACAPFTTVCGGRDNKAGDDALDTAALAVGGSGNQANAKFACVGGGRNNKAGGSFAAIGGGHGNAASEQYAAIGGGYDNTASGLMATVGGGYDNAASGDWATIGGGWFNTARNHYSTVGGGYGDTARADYSGVFSGAGNIAGDAADDTGAVVAGGRDNKAIGMWSSVGGGHDNTAGGAYTFVGGGYANRANGIYATAPGGYVNTASGRSATVAGGAGNTASGDYSLVGGGYGNTASGDSATVTGGGDNTASGVKATVSGGYGNSASVGYATVAGGGDCDVAAAYGFAVGNNSNVNAGHTSSAAFNGMTTTSSGQLRCGTLSKSGGSFTIDHPLDPRGKILNHYFTESPEMVNIYRGVVTLGADGRAAVSLPDYFSALNENPMVQLTGVGGPDVVYVAEKVTGNRFVIGGKPGMEVYWTVTGARKDQSAEIIKLTMPVEQPKTGELAGHSLDDDFLRSTKDQLDRMGVGGQFDFRTAAGRKLYEEMKRPTEDHGGEK